MNRRNLFGVLFGGIAAAFGVAGCGPRSPDKRRVKEKTEIVPERVRSLKN